MIRKYFEQYLTFSKAERHAVIALSAILVILFALPRFLPQEKIKPDSEQLINFEEEKPAVATKSALLPESNGVAVSKAAYKRMYFDPNTLDAAGWVSMGVREKTAVTIQHYLEKGGRFRKAEDLLEIYGLPGELASELVAYVRIPGGGDSRENGTEDRRRKWSDNFRGSENKKMWSDYSGPENSSRTWSGNALTRRSGGLDYPSENGASSGRSTGYSYQSRKIHSGTVDIAIADTSALTTLPGIGSKLAARIVSFRQKLGGFHSIEQLREVFGIQDSLYQQLQPLLSASPGKVTLININTASEETLKSHPYIRWQLAKLIVNYRNEHGPFRAAADLEDLQTLNGEGIKKLLPYVEL